jgi:hypothetical protein
MLLSPDLDLRLKAAGATVQDDVLQLPAQGTQVARQLRVSEGRVFARNENKGRFVESDWRELSIDQVLPYFLNDSPIATWLRCCGADLLQVGFITLGRPR